MTTDLSHIHEGLRHLAVPCSKLTFDPKNARKHDRRNLDTIKSLLTKFGQRMPIVVQKQGMIVRVGNGRLEVARELGWKHIAAVIVDEGDVDAIAFAIGDNRSAELGEWDSAVLADTLHTLGIMAEVGFSEIEFESLTGTLAILDADDDMLANLADPTEELSKSNKMATVRVLIPADVEMSEVIEAVTESVKGWAGVQVRK